MSILNNINFENKSGLDTTKYIVWVAGYIGDAEDTTKFRLLQSDGSFGSPEKSKDATFVNANNGLTISVPGVKNSGNNRLVVTVTSADAPTPSYPITGYTAYPFPGEPGVAPVGPYDIFEFGPNAQYDVSAVDSFGLNLSFKVENDTLTYGVNPVLPRQLVESTFSQFMSEDDYGSAFSQLLYSSPATAGYPPLIKGQFSAIVSPKDWLAIYPNASGLKGYWQETIDDFFAVDNQISLFLNAATVGTYQGLSDGTKYTLTGPREAAHSEQMTIIIPKSDFTGNQPFMQAVRGPQTQATGVATIENGSVVSIEVKKQGSGYADAPTVTIAAPGNDGVDATAIATVANGKVTEVTVTNGGSGYGDSTQVTFSVETSDEYKVFGQIEAALFEACSRGVLLDGVTNLGPTAKAESGFSSALWTEVSNWYSNHNNYFNQKPSVYDAYAKFFHTASVQVTKEIKGKTETESMSLFGKNASGRFAMAYGFSLDENPNVGNEAWPSGVNVPAKTDYSVGAQTVTLTLGPWCEEDS